MLEEENDPDLLTEMAQALDIVSRISASRSSEELAIMYQQLPLNSLTSPVEVDTRPAFLDNAHTPLYIRREIESSYL